MSGRPTDHANIDLCQLNLDVAFGRAGGVSRLIPGGDVRNGGSLLQHGIRELTLARTPGVISGQGSGLPFIFKSS